MSIQIHKRWCLHYSACFIVTFLNIRCFTAFSLCKKYKSPLNFFIDACISDLVHNWFIHKETYAIIPYIFYDMAYWCSLITWNPPTYGGYNFGAHNIDMTVLETVSVTSKILHLCPLYYIYKCEIEKNLDNPHHLKSQSIEKNGDY